MHKLQAGEVLRRFPEPQPTEAWATAFLEELERSLSWGELQAVGVDVRSEDFLYIPSGAWRLQVSRRSPQSMQPIEVSQFNAVRDGMTVYLSAYFGPEVRAAVSLHALLAWAGAENLPEPPTIVPQDRKALSVASSAQTKSSPEASASAEPSAATVPKGGRPAKWDWDAFWVEVVRLANTPDGLPETQAELHRIMMDWCMNSWNNTPADSEIRKRLSRVYALKT
ncbi:hypothetical protein [Teichococcus aestuarii]|uniref:hypothetical protein n=1 Tax=Teichococcus aestuarii TaxID=568898 RepID=UPI0011B1CE60|nr:hypothetical protein [Pseudoroseomonas aestuarii]